MTLVLLGCPLVAQALPTVINAVPNCDTTPDRSVVFQIQNYSYAKFDKQAVPPTKRSSMIYGLQFGFRKMEVGLDTIADRRFSKPESGLYAGPTAVNFKYRLMTQGSDSFSLVVGAFNLGVERFDAVDYYEPSPYFMISKAFNDLRLHLGYQLNLMGFYRLVEADGTKRKNDGFICGFDYPLIKGAHPLMLLVDYVSGPMAMFDVGLGYTISPKWSIGVSSYNPLRDHLPNSPASTLQLPKQFWWGISYTHSY